MLSLGVRFGGTEVTVEESAADGVLVFLEVTTQGSGVTDIPITLTPLTYREFENTFSASLLDQLYPARPSSAATGNQSV